MRITNLEKGEDYNLKPDTQIQVERTNPFFNDYGEQTTPLELPTSERNRRLLGFPDTFGRRVKTRRGLYSGWRVFCAVPADPAVCAAQGQSCHGLLYQRRIFLFAHSEGEAEGYF